MMHNRECSGSSTLVSGRGHGKFRATFCRDGKKRIKGLCGA
jgi:hypothetical protein